MYSTGELLSLVTRASGGDVVTLASLQNYFLREIRNKFSDVLSYSQARQLYHDAREQLKKIKSLSPVFSPVPTRSYDSMFGLCASSFVKPGSVASMFSPAGYLTELYREAKGLHAASSAYNLDIWPTSMAPAPVT